MRLILSPRTGTDGGALRWGGWLVAAVLWALAVEGQKLPLEQTVAPRPFLRWERPAYRNFALNNYANYPDHTIPYADAPRAYYGPMGNYLISGYPIYAWEETRIPGQEWGSAIFKDSGGGLGSGGPWIPVFDSMLIGREGYGNWGYSLIVGDAIMGRFTPLTLSKVNFSGVRLDASTPYLQFTAMGSRVERPKSYVEEKPVWAVENVHFADDSVLLLGSRLQADLGRMQLGLNWVNQHVFQSTRPGNGLKGRLRPDQPLVEWIMVRFADDSPLDGTGGAVVQEVQLVVDGEARPDLVPHVVRHRAGISPQVGRFSQATGEFRPTNYNVYNARRNWWGSNFYRDREIPLYADYLYRLDHEAGIDVSGDTNLEVLLDNMAVDSPRTTLHADGEEQLVFLFNVAAEPRVESIQVEAILANDYRVDVALLSTQSPSGKTYVARMLSTFYRTVLRARGNVRDGSNLKRRRIDIGENTGHFVYSADANLRLAGMEITGEYARSSLYSRYPAQEAGLPSFEDGGRFADRGAAYFVNATRWFERGRAGAEYFAINPEFQTEMRTYLDWEANLYFTNVFGLANETIYWQTVEDNDDGDRYPDRRLGNLPGVINDGLGFDTDGVFLAQDEDNDGIPETNRNLNRIPDYDEPFLMYDVEPNAYAYGFDRNNNDEPDPREDDGEVDYPYDYDQRGYHLFGQWDLTRGWSLAAGHYSTMQIAGHGRNRSTYALLNYRRQGVERLRRLFFENHFRRVRDDIADEYMVTDDDPGPRINNFAGRGIFYEGSRGVYFGDGPPIYFNRFVSDLLRYQDSYVNETYLEGRLNPWSTFNLVQKFRVRLNWQQGGRLHSGLYQQRRRLDYWTWVSRAEYTWNWGKLSATPQFKFMLLRLSDRERDLELQDEIRSIPILRLRYALLSRTALQMGLQGWGPLPYRRNDRVASRFSFEQRTAFATLTNRSRYFGYDLTTIVGISRDEADFDEDFQRFREFDSWSFFVRGVVGFTEFGRAI